MNNGIYCPNKFSYLKIDLEKRLLYNCHKAYPHQITTDWLEKNPGKLFNTEIMINERKEMLAGIRNRSCSHQCYKAEDKGAPSERTRLLENNKAVYTNVLSKIKRLDLTLSSDCRLGCTYCSGLFSSAWRKETKTFGEYAGFGKNWISDLIDQTSQKEKSSSPFFKAFLRELELMDELEEIIITGGEPLLYNGLEDILKIGDKKNTSFLIITGLGVSMQRFIMFIKLIKKYKNIRLSVSAEGLEKHLEFARYGSSFKTFQEYISILEKENINFGFVPTVSNITIFGLYDFYQKYNHRQITYNDLQHPSFLQKHLLDEKSKEIIIAKWSRLNNTFAQRVVKGLEYVPEENEKEKLKIFLKQIQERRKISLEHFPTSFLNWLKI